MKTLNLLFFMLEAMLAINDKLRRLQTNILIECCHLKRFIDIFIFSKMKYLVN